MTEPYTPTDDGVRVLLSRMLGEEQLDKFDRWLADRDAHVLLDASAFIEREPVTARSWAAAWLRDRAARIRAGERDEVERLRETVDGENRGEDSTGRLIAEALRYKAERDAAVARAEAAEAERDKAVKNSEYWFDNRKTWVDTVDRVRALADEWERDARAEGFHHALPLGKVADLRRALDGGDPDGD